MSITIRQIGRHLTAGELKEGSAFVLAHKPANTVRIVCGTACARPDFVYCIKIRSNGGVSLEYIGSHREVVPINLDIAWSLK